MRQKSTTILPDLERLDISAKLRYRHDEEAEDHEDIRQRIERVTEDLKDLNDFYNVSISPLRTSRLKDFYAEELASLRKENFDSYDQQGKIDFLLLQNYLKKNLGQLDLDAEKDRKMEPVLPFAPSIVRLCEDRQQMKPMDAQKAAGDVHSAANQAKEMNKKILAGDIKMEKTIAFRAANTVERLRKHLAEWFGFFRGYDPVFTWWMSEPYSKIQEALAVYASTIREELVGVKPGDDDAIIGDPIGREGLLADIEAEMIPYSPEELLQIGEKEYVWCEKEMKKAASDLGYDDWRDALEHVKDLYVPPGEFPQAVVGLANEATEYVKKHDLITVPRIAEETWRTFMMSPAAQKVNPFFLGGESIIVSYPDDTMGHEEKLMSMRGNNVYFSRSTVFHEMIPGKQIIPFVPAHREQSLALMACLRSYSRPSSALMTSKHKLKIVEIKGHHLQYYHIARYRSYRQLFDTPFWMEGWALYWELLLYSRSFPSTPEQKIGMLFWRMHRCIRIIFSLSFHLNLLLPQECIDMLVERVGHERATAEGEVRRSLNGDYSPLYQAGYMLGGLQIWALRKEVLEGGLPEKKFHDRVMKEGEMPIEMLRALMKGEKVTPDFKTRWRFYDDL